jgi:lysozyme
MTQITQFDIARRFLKVHEGLRLTEYKDTTGNRTIGYGWNTDAKLLPADMGKISDGKLTITEAEADVLLETSMHQHWDELASRFGTVHNLNPWRQAVLLDMAFNMGVPTLLTFKNTLSLITSGDFDGASRLMLESKWAKQVKRRADILSDVMRRGNMDQRQLAVYGFGTWEHY